MVTLFQHVSTLAGRILLSAIFLTSGVSHILNWRDIVGRMESAEVPLPNLLLVLAIVCLLLGGLSVLIGLRARLGAVLLILFLIPTTLIFHGGWTSGSSGATDQMLHYMKNLGILGGLLMVLAFGAGGFSIDLLLRMKKVAKHQ